MSTIMVDLGTTHTKIVSLKEGLGKDAAGQPLFSNSVKFNINVRMDQNLTPNDLIGQAAKPAIITWENKTRNMGFDKFSKLEKEVTIFIRPLSARGEVPDEQLTKDQLKEKIKKLNALIGK